jgi:hypothetical protein
MIRNEMKLNVQLSQHCDSFNKTTKDDRYAKLSHVYCSDHVPLDLPVRSVQIMVRLNSQAVGRLRMSRAYGRDCVTQLQIALEEEYLLILETGFALLSSSVMFCNFTRSVDSFHIC